MAPLAHFAYEVPVVGGYAHIPCRQCTVMFCCAQGTGGIGENNAGIQEIRNEAVFQALQFHFRGAGGDDYPGARIDLTAACHKHDIWVFRNRNS